MITKKIFNYNDSAVLIIGRLVELHFSGQIEKKITDNISLNLPIINMFIKSSDYTISKLFIN